MLKSFQKKVENFQNKVENSKNVYFAKKDNFEKYWRSNQKMEKVLKIPKK